MKKRILITAILALLCVGACCACESKVDNAVKFVNDAADKTASVRNLSVKVNEVYANYSGNDYTATDLERNEEAEIVMCKKSYVVQYTGTESRRRQGWSTYQWEKDGDKAVEKSTFSNVTESSETIARKDLYEDVLITLARNPELKKFLKKDAKVVKSGNGVRYVSCMMTYGDLEMLGMGELNTSHISRPVRLRFYVNKKGYLCEVQMDMPIYENGDGKVYTNSYKFSKFNKSSWDPNMEENINVVEAEPFPSGEDNSTLTREMVLESYDLPNYKQGDLDKYKGIHSPIGHYGYTVSLKEDGTVIIDEEDASEELVQEVSTWTDVVYVDSSSRGVVAIKKDGSLLEYVYDSGAFENADFSQFTDLVSVNLEYRAAFGLRKDGTVVATGEKAPNVKGLKDAVKMSAYDENVIILKKDGTVEVVSEYCSQQDVSGWKDIVDIAAGRFHVVGLKKDGTVVTAGNNPLEEDGKVYGEHKVQDWKDVVSVFAGNMSTIGIKKDGTVVATGYECEHLNEWMDVVTIANNDMNYDGIRSDGRIYGYDWELDEDTE